MKGWGRLFLGLAVLTAPLQPALAAQKPRAIARLAGLDGKPLGTADFRAVDRGVLIEFDLHNLAPAPTPCTCIPRPIATPKAASAAPGRS